MNSFVARQPIFDDNKKVIAYELLFRNSNKNLYESKDADLATISVISDGFLLMGMDNLTGAKRAFINFTDTLIKKGVIQTLPKEMLVVEILEDVEVDKELILSCEKLKELGYTLALDDFVFDHKFQPLIDLADIIKIDFILTSKDSRREIFEKITNKKIKFLAEKVETQEEYEEAVELGFSYFQGYFFSKPVVISAKDIPVSTHGYLMLLSKLANMDIDFVQIEEIIKKDVSLSFKFLRFINSANFGFRNEIHSIKHALILLGREEVIKWIYLITLKDMGQSKPDELMKISVIRGRFGELISGKINLDYRKSDIFFMGILSLIDVITDMTMESVISEMPIAEDIKEALLGKDNIFRDVYELITYYEGGEWDKFSEKANKLNIDEKLVPKIYLESIQWAEDFF